MIDDSQLNLLDEQIKEQNKIINCDKAIIQEKAQVELLLKDLLKKQNIMINCYRAIIHEKDQVELLLRERPVGGEKEIEKHKEREYQLHNKIIELLNTKAVRTEPEYDPLNPINLDPLDWNSMSIIKTEELKTELKKNLEEK